MTTFGRALAGLAVCYPLSFAALMAGIASTNHASWSYLVLLGFYGWIVRTLWVATREAPAGQLALGLATLLTLAHAGAALLFCIGPGSIRDSLISVLLLGVAPIQSLVGIGLGQAARALGRPILAFGLYFTLVWWPTLFFGLAAFLLCFAAQALLVAVLAWRSPVPVEDLDDGLGFSRA